MFHDKITTHVGGKASPVGIPPHGACPGRHQQRASGPPCTGSATGIMRPPTRFPGSSDAGCRGARRPQTSCAPMPSRPPPEGPMTFRPCSDARADKTDLHAYDGDRPKLSHRTERRECARCRDRVPITLSKHERQAAAFPNEYERFLTGRARSCPHADPPNLGECEASRCVVAAPGPARPPAVARAWCPVRWVYRAPGCGRGGAAGGPRRTRRRSRRRTARRTGQGGSGATGHPR
jgi:hypothetical protein